MPSTLPPPSKSYTKEFQFYGKPYDVSAVDPSEIFVQNVSRVRLYIEKNLSKFAGLNTLIELALGDGSQYSSPSIFIDARSTQVRLLESPPDGVEPGVVANIMPEYVLDVINGHMYAQHAFKRAKPPFQGAFAGCFAPMGCPELLTDSADLDFKTLPKPTENIEQIKYDLQEWGYAFLQAALSPQQVKILRTAIEEQAAGEREAGVAHMDFLYKNATDQPNQRVWNLPNKGDEFLDLLNHPMVDAIVPWFLGDGFHLHSMQANIVRPGESGTFFHRDQMGLTPETISHAYLLNVMWYLVDVTEEIGATRIYPGSHNKNVAPLNNMLDVGGSIPAVGPAGTCLLMDSRTWHSIGVNTTKTTRPIILQNFTRSFLREMENYQLLLHEDIKAKLSDRQRALLGFPLPGRQMYTVNSRPGENVGSMRIPVS